MIFNKLKLAPKYVLNIYFFLHKPELQNVLNI